MVLRDEGAHWRGFAYRADHSVTATAANVRDSRQLGELLHDKEIRVWGDSAYRGQGDVIAKAALDFTHEKGTRNRPLSELQRARNRTKSKVRSRVEHPFLVIKRIFGFTKGRYKGLAKNTHRVEVACALANLYLVRRRLLRLA